MLKCVGSKILGITSNEVSSETSFVENFSMRIRILIQGSVNRVLVNNFYQDFTNLNAENLTL